MKLTVSLKLLPTPEQFRLLLDTLARANSACNALSATAWQTRTFDRRALQRLTYYATKTGFKLTAQLVVRCIAKVADAYLKDRTHQRRFRRHGGIAYDDRLLRFKAGHQVSLWTLAGRIVIPYLCGVGQECLLSSRRGEVDLVLRRGEYFLQVVCEVEEPHATQPADYLGIDLGIVNLATDSDGQVHPGEDLERRRRRWVHRRRNLQRRGTRAAKRKLKKLAGKQARYQRDLLHRISKAIVQKAERTERGIALENLRGIGGRVTARRRQRARLANWGYCQLRSFIEYKARRAGVFVYLVDPRNSSRTCPECGCVDRRNRVSQALFRCTRCGHSALADWCAARIIRARAVANRPMVAAGASGKGPALGQLQAPCQR